MNTRIKPDYPLPFTVLLWVQTQIDQAAQIGVAGKAHWRAFIRFTAMLLLLADSARATALFRILKTLNAAAPRGRRLTVRELRALAFEIWADAIIAERDVSRKG